jgi:hypothetical protein
MHSTEEKHEFVSGALSFCKEAGLSPAETSAVVTGIVSLGGDAKEAFQEYVNDKDGVQHTAG